MLLSLVFAATVSTLTPRVDAVAVTDAQTAMRVNNGELSDEIWQLSNAVDAFVQRDPEEGGTPSQRTEFRVAYDMTTLYVKVRAFDSEASRIRGYLTRRDADSPSDWIRVLIDSYHDRRTAYEFAVNPVGVKADRYWYNDNSRDDSWDAVWDVKVSTDEQGWTAEFRIPFSQLRFNPTASSTFGFAVSRQIARLNETSTWPLLARSANGYVSSFGDLGGLSMAGAPKRLEIVPYTVADLTTQPTGGNPLLKSSAPSGAVGMDMKYALTPGLTLTTTINPDFGQVEADPAVVNLSAFETFFSERRPFFIEGLGNLQFGLECPDCNGLFYSRRVGRAPHGTDNLPSGDNIYTDVPVNSTILGAAKLTGRVGKFAIGVMEAVQQKESATVFDGLSTFRRPVEPLTSYTVGRVRREFRNQSSFGGVFTAANRQLDTLTFLPGSAYAGGIDWDWRFKSFYSLAGNLIASRVNGTAEAIDQLQENSRHYYQRPDATSFDLDATRTSLSGTAGRFAFSKIGGQRVRFNSNMTFKSPGFDVNEVGFFRRADMINTGNWLQIRSDVPTKRFRNRNINFNYFSSWNYDGNQLGRGWNVNANVTWINNWEMGGGYGGDEPGFDDRLTRGGPIGRTNRFQIGWMWLNSDRRKPVSINTFFGRGGDGQGSGFRDFNPELTFRPSTAINVTAGVRFNRNPADSQWITNLTDPTDRYIFGHLDQTTVALTGRVNYTMTPNLSLQLYGEPFVSGGEYSAFKELVDGRNPDYVRRYRPLTNALELIDDPNFNVKSFRTTNVLRWEYKPGSTLFIVWQQARQNDDVAGSFRFGRDFRDIFRSAPRNVFLVKLAYWLNY
jgi:Domain of unknown function (DUF5916)/Carbohydrate family 9 binding domain-like